MGSMMAMRSNKTLSTLLVKSKIIDIVFGYSLNFVRFFMFRFDSISFFIHLQFSNRIHSHFTLQSNAANEFSANAPAWCSVFGCFFFTFLCISFYTAIVPLIISFSKLHILKWVSASPSPYTYHIILYITQTTLTPIKV